jgi:thiol-disulfide isomerase/thioredoxin
MTLNDESPGNDADDAPSTREMPNVFAWMAAAFAGLALAGFAFWSVRPHRSTAAAAVRLPANKVEAKLQEQPRVLSSELTALMSRAGFSPDTGRLAPPLQFRDGQGTPCTLEQFRGRLVLVVFWGPTCDPCLKELPELENLATRFDQKDFIVLPLCIEETRVETARAVAAQHAPHLPIYVDSDGSVRNDYAVAHLPQGFLVDADGHTLARYFGAKVWADGAVNRLFEACIRATPRL